MTKDEFFKMRDRQRKAGLIQDYQPKIYKNNLLPDEEHRLIKALNGQNHGIYRTIDLDLTRLLCVETYVGTAIKCQRKKIDQIDNITVWRI